MKKITAHSLVTQIVTKNDEPLAKVFHRWLKDKNMYTPIGDANTKDIMQNCAYKVCSSMNGIYFEKIIPKTAELYKFDSGPMKEVLSEIDKFWSLRQDYCNLGFVYSRGILLHGDPGSGKTSILNQVTELITGKGDIVIYASDTRTLKEGLKAVRDIEKERKIVVILEDMDELLRYGETELLHLLDGQDKVDGVVYLGTTNYIQNFPPRLLRSGRFDKKIHVPQPPAEGRRVYFANKLLSKGYADAAEIEDLVVKTEGMSFGDLAELITAVYILKEPLNDAVSRLGKNTYKEKEESENLMPSYNNIKIRKII